MLMEAPDYLQAHSSSLLVNETSRSSDTKAAGAIDNFRVEELLDFSNGDLALADCNGSLDCFNASSTDSSTLTHVDSSNSSSFSGCEPPVFPCDFSADIQFSSDLCLPYDDLAELEWISNVTEESFSSEDLQKLQLITGMKATPREDPGGNSAAFQPEMSVPAKARSKRSRGAPRIWTSRLPLLAPTSSSSENDIIAAVQANSAKKTSLYVKSHRNGESPKTGRKCVHCATDQTPQWRTGPMGPKTLCNACGVRFKSGRLVPEYRPAASPTFVLTKHSNSHRKVVELRRQKEMMGTHQNHSFHGENMLLDASEGGKYLFKRNAGPDFSQLI